MKHILQHLKTSGIMSGSGLVSCAGAQYIASNLANDIWKTVAMFLFFTAVGVTNKLIMERVAIKKEILDK